MSQYEGEKGTDHRPNSLCGVILTISRNQGTLLVFFRKQYEKCLKTQV